jgi:hypothetical protein
MKISKELEKCVNQTALIITDWLGFMLPNQTSTYFNNSPNAILIDNEFIIVMSKFE